MPIEGDNAAVDPENAQPANAQSATETPADDVLDLKETELLTSGSSSAQQADPGQPDEVEATHAENGADENRVLSGAPSGESRSCPSGPASSNPPRGTAIRGRSSCSARSRQLSFAAGNAEPRWSDAREEAWPGKEWLLNRALRIDDDVAEALYSQNRLVPTYTKSQVTPLKNNYNGATPDPSYIPEWHLQLRGLASGLSVSLSIRNLLTRFQMHDQITRFVCVEGWSAIAWWSGLRFDDLLQAYPPVSQANWIRVESSVNLDPWGNPDPYFVSLDIPTARQPQTLLATHFNGQPLTVGHGAPLRLLVPVKLGLKNVKAVTRISYLKEQPKDYWAERGYSCYDGI